MRSSILKHVPRNVADRPNAVYGKSCPAEGAIFHRKQKLLVTKIQIEFILVVGNVLKDTVAVWKIRY